MSYDLIYLWLFLPGSKTKISKLHGITKSEAKQSEADCIKMNFDREISVINAVFFEWPSRESIKLS